MIQIFKSLLYQVKPLLGKIDSVYESSPKAMKFRTFTSSPGSIQEVNSTQSFVVYSTAKKFELVRLMLRCRIVVNLNSRLNVSCLGQLGNIMLNTTSLISPSINNTCLLWWSLSHCLIVKFCRHLRMSDWNFGEPRDGKHPDILTLYLTDKSG